VCHPICLHACLPASSAGSELRHYPQINQFKWRASGMKILKIAVDARNKESKKNARGWAGQFN